MPESIFSFEDYRSFLKAYAESKKKSKPSFTYGSWAKNMGLASSSGLTMLLNGQRTPGPEMRAKICRYFKFNAKERSYFEKLVMLAKSRDNLVMQRMLIDDLKRQNPNASFKKLDFKTFDVISNWYYYAIREMIHLSDFQNSPKWIVNKLRFNVTVPQVKKAISDLVDEGLLALKDGRLKVTTKAVGTPDDIDHEGLKVFHEQSLKIAVEAVRAVPANDRYLGSTTMTIKRENLSKAKALIRAFESEFTELFEEEGGDTTIQLNVQIIPLTKCAKL